MTDIHLTGVPEEPGAPDPGDGRQWCSGCRRWKFLAIHSCPGVPQHGLLGRDAQGEVGGRDV